MFRAIKVPYEFIFLSRCFTFGAGMSECLEGPDLHSGATFFPSGLRLSELRNNGIKWTSAMRPVPPPEYQKVPHVGLHTQPKFWGSDWERKYRELREESISGRKEEEMEREERRRSSGSLSTSVQTVDDGTEVVGRPTAPRLEQLKCGLTTCWLSHAALDCRHHLEWSLRVCRASDLFSAAENPQI